MYCVKMAGLPMAGLMLILAGCSSVTEGTSQALTIATDPPGAECTLIRAGQNIGRTVTPGVVTVHKARNDIGLACRLPGYEDGKALIKYDMAASTVGNVLIGGGIGLIIDAATNASIKYDKVTSITMAKASGDSVAAKPAGMQVASVVAAPPSVGTPAHAPLSPKAKLTGNDLWKISEPVLKTHFEKNRDQYCAYLDARYGHSLRLNKITMVEDRSAETEGFYAMVVRWEGQGVKLGVPSPAPLGKDFYYRLREDNNTVSVVDWRVQARN